MEGWRERRRDISKNDTFKNKNYMVQKTFLVKTTMMLKSSASPRPFLYLTFVVINTVLTFINVVLEGDESEPTAYLLCFNGQWEHLH